MASIPHRRSGQSQSHELEGSSTERRSSIPQSATSEDSQLSLLNHPSSSENSPKPSASPEVHQRSEIPRPKPHSTHSSAEPRKCWICLQNETEDTPTSSQWRFPCACKLEAHESCLLDWAAEVEKPRPGSATRSKVECPQCKTPIQIVRPRALVPEIVRKIQRIQARLTLPFTAVALLGGLTYGCYMYGLNTIYVIFGTKDANRLLYPGRSGSHSNLEFMLPVIPMALLASRTHYADSLLPALPIFYFTLNQPSRNAKLWPPSATMTLIALPYIRAAYNESFKYLFAGKEKAWLQEIQPRGGDPSEQDEQPAHEHAGAEGDGMNIELGIQLEVIEEDDVEQNGGPPPERAEEQPAEQPAAQPNDGGGGAEQQNAQPPAPQAENPVPDQHNGANAANAVNAIPIIVNVVLENAIGALLFPTIASTVGIALEFALPRKWTTPPGRWENYPVGFLQSRFGRSIAGGCLFVVLKDSLLLYSKYKMAQVHKHRRILDYDSRKQGDQA